MSKPLPVSWKETFKPEEDIELDLIVNAIRSVPKKEWDKFFKRFQAQQLQRALSATEMPTEVVAKAKAINLIQNFFGEVLG